MANEIARSFTTFLVAAALQPSDEEPTIRDVYAVVARSRDEAVTAVRILVDPTDTLTIVGSLSSRMTKAIRLEPGEVRTV